MSDAIAALENDPLAKLIAGGTNLVDLLKYDVERPSRVVDITGLPLDTIDDTPEGGVRIGALVTNSDVAYDERIASRYPLLASAILAGASGQLRNAATSGGNLFQRTRCAYFYDSALPCNKRDPGSGCPAISGVNRGHAILGTSEACIATHPSDMCVALAALGATVQVIGPNGTRTIAFPDFHRLPGDTPQDDTTVVHGELVTSIELPPDGFSVHYSYLKVRDRLSYAFALVSVAAALRIDGAGVAAANVIQAPASNGPTTARIAEARIAIGGVAHKPWRVLEAETLLVGQPPTESLFASVADRLLEGARSFAHNGFKIELARRTIIRALAQAAAGTPQSQNDKRIR